MRGWYPPSSSGVHVLRLVMWTLTTPFMVYLLSKLSDFRRDKVSCGAGAQQVGRGGGLCTIGSPLRNRLLSSSVLFSCETKSKLSKQTGRRHFATGVAGS